ncbi:FAD-dependent oxidoreductase [Marinimicrobium sp. C6131]|uniref:FAD-dependent oxidoreductase n=1 Tax=Marinimicrobium sp. C6131 TaxID=3022676 RepID=UPI00223CEF68|nr:FAD-dependent oxidoreductase [Marinimicrobium sp. C6131]UZJ44533.1 FAD-dependent oxidoreductase [Marinimicrobium sp. C6131]
MLLHDASPEGRQNTIKRIDAELVVIGGGLSGCCAAISAARAGKKVCLIQDRPVLGGNASSEVRLWSLGATSHMGNNNRWSREGGIIDELLLENLYRNPEGNTVIFDTVLLDKVRSESNITLLLNTAVYNTLKDSARHITSVQAFCSQNSITYDVHGHYFCDASGDGLVAFQAGAAFRIGAESREEFDEKLAPEKADTELLGHSIYFYSKDVGRPVNFEPPSFASIDKVTLDRIKRIRRDDIGPRLWWLEYGGNCNTIEETEEIKWELWKIVYGVWDYIKNSGNFHGVENLTLEWVGTIPGKRESRRFEGLYMMTQKDIVEQSHFPDAVSYGGWSIDHHPGDGVYSNKAPCRQFHSKGVYQIPLRCMISKDIDNLFFAGRIISASHIAFGSTRVMCTCAHGGQAVGQAVALCVDNGLQPKELLKATNLELLHSRLNEMGHYIPGVPYVQDDNLASSARLEASSELVLEEIPKGSSWVSLGVSAAQWLPMNGGTVYAVRSYIRSTGENRLKVQLRVSSKRENFTPDVVLEEADVVVEPGEQEILIKFSKAVPEDQYGLICFLGNEKLEVACSDYRITGLVSVFNGKNEAVSNTGVQVAGPDSGIDEFEFWIPERRPDGRNLALSMYPPVSDFSVRNLISDYTRPFLRSNAWVAALDDDEPEVILRWDEAQLISRVTIYFDTDLDHALESSLYHHPERTMPFCVSDYEIYSDDDCLLRTVSNNYLSRNEIVLDEPVRTSTLCLRLKRKNNKVPVSIFGLSVK